MISSNKQWWSLYPRWESPSFRMAIRNELHTTRLNTIHKLAEAGEFDLYGNGWESLSLPPQFTEVAVQIRKLNPRPVPNKMEILTKYNYAVCIENTSLRGYITEKSIHGLIAGCNLISKEDHRQLIEYSWTDTTNPYRYSSFAKLVMDAVL